MNLRKAIFGLFFVIIGVISGFNGVISAPHVYADEETAETTEVTETNDSIDLGLESEIEGKNCQDSMGSIGWLVCPTTGKISKAVDWLYARIQNVLTINPISAADGSPIYEIWKYFLSVTNIIFIIFLLVVVYSQLTGLGISNYGIKKALPKLIVTAILVNLSFLICSLAVDVSNILGNGIRNVFSAIGDTTVVGNTELSASLMNAKMWQVAGASSSIAIIATAIAVESGAIWMLIPVVLGAIVAVVTGLVTIALRQAVVVLLVMISPLAIVAYMLPNTEQWFKKWKQLLIRMLVFYPVFSLLFGASNLAGFAIIASAKDAFGLLLGVAVQIFPLFFSWSLMKMSGTVLGTINSKMQNLLNKPVAASRAAAESARISKKANTLARGRTPYARLTQYLNKRQALREEDTKNSLDIASNKAAEYVQQKIAGVKIGEPANNSHKASRYTRNAKMARNYSLISQNAKSQADHVLGNYGDYFEKNSKNNAIAEQAKNAWIDYGRAAYQKDIDDENDINFLVDKYLSAFKRDASGKPVDEVAFNRYVTSVFGPNPDQQLLVAKIISQAAKVESKRRAEYNIMMAKYGHNGYNKGGFRSFAVGYMVNDDGWAVDQNGDRLKNADGTYVEMIQGEAMTKAPEKLVLYDKRDEQGIYYDLKDQDGNIVARVHRGVGDDGVNHDDPAFLKEVLSNYDIPIADPINNVYSILSGVKPGDIITPQGKNDIGLARYSTTIGRAMDSYKVNAAWSGAMFNSGIGNRQIKNSAQYALWTLDSIKKTLKPGAFNTQNPASVEYLTTLFNPDNWEKIFTEEEIAKAVNIGNSELVGGEDWEVDENGVIVNYTPVENPTYEQRMNTLKRKLLYPAMAKILPAFDRLRTSNTIDNQKPGTADAQYEFLKMVEEKWENNNALNFDPTLVEQDLQSAVRAFRQRKHDKDGNLIYTDNSSSNYAPENLLNLLEEAYDNSVIVEDLKRNIFTILGSKDAYSRALVRFEELCNENPDATMQDIYNWFSDLDLLVK